MKAKIGTRLLAELTPRERPFHVYDTELPCFILRVQPSGSKTYYYDYRVHGRPKLRMKIGTSAVLSPVQARDLVKLAAAQVAQGIDPQTAKNKVGVPTMREFITGEYADWIKTHKKTGDLTIKMLTARFAGFMDWRLDEFSLFEVEKWITKRLSNGVKPQTVNKNIVSLKAMLKKAFEWEKVPEHPLRKLNPCKVLDAGRERFLSVDEEIRLRKALEDREKDIRAGRDRGNTWRKSRNYDLFPSFEGKTYADYVRPMVLLILNTGLRRGEVCKLKKDKVDLENRVIAVVGMYSKNGKTRRIPLNDEALSVLTSWFKDTAENPSEYVFPSRDGLPIREVKRAWASVLRRAKITDFRFHDQRHSFSSRLVKNGVALNTLRELLGHHSQNMVLRYAHLGLNTKAEAVATLTIPGTPTKD